MATQINDPFKPAAAIVDPYKSPAPPAQTGVGASDYAKAFGSSAIQGAAGLVRGGAEAIRSLSPSLPAADLIRGVSDVIGGVGTRMNESMSQPARDAMANSTPEGSIADPSSWSLGKAPTVGGYALQLVSGLGSTAPTIAAGIASRGRIAPTAAAAAGTGGGFAANDESQRVRDLPDAEIAKLPGYQERLRSMTPAQARESLALDAGNSAFRTTAPVSAADALTEVLPFTGGAQRLLGRAVGSSRVARAAAGGVISGVGEGLQEVAEQAAQTYGGDQVTGENRDLLEGSAANFALGAIVGGPLGAAGGLAQGVDGAPAVAAETAPAPAPAAPAADVIGESQDAATVVTQAQPTEADPIPAQVETTIVDPQDGALSRAIAEDVAGRAGTPVGPVEVTTVLGREEDLAAQGDQQDQINQQRTVQQKKADQVAAGSKPGKPAPAAVTEAPAAPVSIGQDTREALRARGWNEAQMRGMSPERAAQIIDAGEAPAPDPAARAAAEQRPKPTREQIEAVIQARLDSNPGPVDVRMIANALGAPIREVAEIRRAMRTREAQQTAAPAATTPEAIPNGIEEAQQVQQQEVGPVVDDGAIPAVAAGQDSSSAPAVGQAAALDAGSTSGGSAQASGREEGQRQAAVPNLTYPEDTELLDGDITPPSGAPWSIRDAAEKTAARTPGGRVFELDDGTFVVRTPTEQVDGNDRDRSETARAAAPRDPVGDAARVDNAAAAADALPAAAPATTNAAEPADSAVAGDRPAAAVRDGFGKTNARRVARQKQIFGGATGEAAPQAAPAPGERAPDSAPAAPVSAAAGTASAAPEQAQGSQAAAAAVARSSAESSTKIGESEAKKSDSAVKKSADAVQTPTAGNEGRSAQPTNPQRDESLTPKVRVKGGKPQFVHDAPETLRAYYQPGELVKSYGGGTDRVISFQPAAPGSRWSVKVIAVNQDGSPKVGEVERSHFTEPTFRELVARFGPPKKPEPKKAAKKAAPDAESTPGFEVERLVDGQMRPIAFQKGEQVQIAGTTPMGTGTIDGISVARKEFRSGKSWFPFGSAYKADYDQAARPRDEIRSTLAMLESRLDNGNTIDSTELLDGARDQAKAAGLSDEFAEQIATLRSRADQQRAAAAIAGKEQRAGEARSARQEAKRLASPIREARMVMEDLSAGSATVDDVRSSFARVRDQKQEVMAELNAMTIPQLQREYGLYDRRDKKATVESAYQSLLGMFTLGKMRAFRIEGDYRQSYLNAVQASVEALTEADLLAYSEARQEAAKARQSVADGIKEPQTLADYQRLAQVLGSESSMTAEQRAEFDRLRTDVLLEQRAQSAAASGVVPQVSGAPAEMSITETTHTKKGTPLFVVRMGERVERDVYTQLNAAAKKLGGYYSAFRGAGAVPGFQFPTRDAAEKFVALRDGDQDRSAQVDARQADRRESQAESLAQKAETLRERANAALGADRKANTRRRAAMAASAEAAAQRELQLADTMTNIAKSIEDGTARTLGQVRHRTQVEMLESALGRAAWDFQQQAGVSWEDAKSAPITAEMVASAELPRFRVARGDIIPMIGQLRRARGGKQLSDALYKRVDFTEEYAEAVSQDPLRFALQRSDGKLAAFRTKKEAEAALANTIEKKTESMMPLPRTAIVKMALPDNVTGRAVKEIADGPWLVSLSPEAAIEQKRWSPDYDKKVALSYAEASKVRDVLGDKGVAGWFAGGLERRKQLEAIGIDRNSIFREALREYIQRRGAPVQEDRVKKMERDLVGKNVGADFFPTPPALVERLVEQADIQPGMRLLEPSAGKGDIAEKLALAAEGVQVDTVEISSTLRELLEAKGFEPSSSDFMEFTDADGYDRIVMNPPFSNGLDADHVRHAYDLLRPGGRLVAITGEGIFSRSDRKATEFREWLDSVGGVSEKLPDGSFRSSFRPTGVATREVIIDKRGGALSSPDPTDGASAGRSAYSRPLPDRSRDARTHIVGVNDLTRHVNSIVGRWRGDIPVVRVVEQASQLPDFARREAGWETAEGYYNGQGTIYLVARNLPNLTRAEQVLAHEAFGHYGVEAVVGKEEWARVIGDVARLRADPAAMSGDMQAAMASTERRYGSADGATFAREFLAVMAERGVSSSTLSRVLAALRRWARELFGLRVGRWSDAELREIVANGMRQVAKKSAERQGQGRGQALSRPDSADVKQTPDARSGVVERTEAGRTFKELLATRETLDAAVAAGSARQLLDGIARQAGIGEDQRLLAERLAPLVERLGVKLIEPPANSVDAGTYSTATNSMWVRQAVPSVALHEALHGVTSAMMTSPMLRKANANVRAAIEQMESTLEAVRAHVRDPGPVGIPANIQRTLEDPRGPMSNTKELLTYGMTDKAFQAFLAAVPMPATSRSENAWVAFKSAIGRMLGLRGLTRTALDSVMDASTDLIAFAESNPVAARLAQMSEANRLSYVARTDPSRFMEMIGQARNGDEGLVQRIKDKLEDARPSLLGALTLRQMGEVTEKYLPAVGSYVDTMTEMASRRGVLQDEVGELAQRWQSMQTADRRAATADQKRTRNTASDRTVDLMHDATIAGTDPAEDYRVSTATLKNNGDTVALDPVSGKAAIEQINRQLETLRAEPDSDVKEARRRTLLSDRKTVEMGMEREASRAAEYPKLKRQFNALPEQWQALYREVRDSYVKRSEETLQALIDRIETLEIDGREKKALVDRMRANYESGRVEAPYFPLARFGEYWASFEKPGENGAEADKQFVMAETKADRDRAIKAAERAGYKVSGKGRKIDNVRAQDGASGTFVSDVNNILSTAGVDEKVRDEVYQLYLRTMPDLSTRKNFIHRKKIAGYDQDALRAYANNMFHSSHQLAKLEFGPRLENQVKRAGEQVKAAQKEAGPDADRSSAALNELKRRHEWVMNPTTSNWANNLSSLNFVFYLGLTPAAAVINLSQTAITTYPALASRYGAMPALNQMLSTFRDSIKNLRFGDSTGIARSLTSPDERRAYEDLRRMGAIDVTQAHDLAGLAENGTSGYNPTVHRVMNGISLMFHKAEVVNRETSGIAAYRLARDAGKSHDQAVKEASDTIWQTHFDYSSSNRARFMQSDAAKVLFAFKQYSQSMTYYLWRSFYEWSKGETPQVRREARNRMVGAIGMTGVFSGLMGMPLLSVMFGIANAAAAAFGDDDEPWDAEIEFRNFLADMLGPTVGRMAQEGLIEGGLGAVGLSSPEIGSRVSLNDLWFRAPDAEVEGRDLYLHMLEQAAGPIAGMLGAQVTGAALIGEGLDTGNDAAIWRGVEKMMPKAVRDSMKALRYETQGVNTLRGDPLIADTTVLQGIYQGLGFTPAEVIDQYEVNGARKNYEGYIKDRRSMLLDAYGLAVKHSDSDASAQTLAKIREFNKANPEVAISMSAIRASLKSRQALSERSVNGVMLDKRTAGRVKDSVRFGSE